MNTFIDTAFDRIKAEGRYVSSKSDLRESLAVAPYLIVRPTAEFGDYTITANLSEAEGCQFRIGYVGRPPKVIAFFDSPIIALDILLQFKAANPGCAAWYDGNEIYTEIACWNDLVNGLSHEVKNRPESKARKIVEDYASEGVGCDGDEDEDE